MKNTKAIIGLWYQCLFGVRRITSDGTIEYRDEETPEKTVKSDFTVEEFNRYVGDGSWKLVPGQTKPVSPAERVRRVLKTLAERKDIVGYLTKRGIKGKPLSGCYCIIASFVQQKTGISIKVQPWHNPNWVIVGDMTMHVLHPRLVDLARKFDGGNYPQLHAA